MDLITFIGFFMTFFALLFLFVRPLFAEKRSKTKQHPQPFRRVMTPLEITEDEEEELPPVPLPPPPRQPSIKRPSQIAPKRNAYTISKVTTPSRGTTVLHKMPSLQDAFIIHEILSAPKALRPTLKQERNL